MRVSNSAILIIVKNCLSIRFSFTLRCRHGFNQFSTFGWLRNISTFKTLHSFAGISSHRRIFLVKIKAREKKGDFESPGFHFFYHLKSSFVCVILLMAEIQLTS